MDLSWAIIGKKVGKRNLMGAACPVDGRLEKCLPAPNPKSLKSKAGCEVPDRPTAVAALLLAVVRSFQSSGQGKLAST